MSHRMLIKFLKVIFLVSTASFLVIQIHLRRQAVVSYKKQQQTFLKDDQQTVFDSGGDAGKNSDEPTSINRQKFRSKNHINNNVNSSLDNIDWSAVSRASMPTKDQVRRSVEFNNLNAEILNDEKFQSLPIDHVIVVQVHNRSQYLEKLIQSISRAPGIDRTVLVFSHDFFSREINRLVQSITFCRVLQIFYPFNIQIYSDTFPGQDPQDCPPKVGKIEAEKINCNNWKDPDKYGNYRVAKYSQVKHHWWWKMNYVFDGVARLRHFNGWVLLLEEDHYVSPDFLHVFQQIIDKKKELCSECAIITLGAYLKSYNAYAETTSQLAIQPWFSSRHNMGMSLNRDTWNRIRDCAKNFCYFDDYNWDWSLMHVNLKCMKPPPFKVLFAKAPRVFHIGDCGIHHSGKQCTADSSATMVQEILNKASDQLFPKDLKVTERTQKTLKAPKENGGWGDSRDHELCMQNVLQQNSTK